MTSPIYPTYYGTQRLAAYSLNAGNDRPVAAVPPPEPAPRQPEDSPPLFQPIQKIRQTVGADGSGGATYAHRPVQPSFSARYDSSPVSIDARSLVAAPHVDFTREAGVQVNAVGAYRWNAQIAEFEPERAKARLDIKV